MLRPTTIRGYLTALVLASTLPLVGLWAFTAWSHVRFRQESAWSMAHQVAQSTTANARQFLGDSRRMLESMAAAAASENFNWSDCGSFLLDATVAAPQYRGFSISDAEGSVLCTSVPTDVQSVRDRDWFRLVSVSGAFSVGMPVIGLVSGEWVSVLAIPISNDQGDRLGYLTAAANMALFQELLNISSLPEEAVTSIVTTAGVIVARSRDPERWVGQRLDISDREHENVESRERTAPSAEGVPYMWAWEDLPEANWLVYSGLPADWALQRSLPSLGLGILFGSGLVLAVLLLASGVYRRVSHSLADLVEGTRHAAKDAAHLDETGLAEVAEVARQFNATLSDRNEAEAALRSAKELYQSVLENAALGILVVASDGNILEANTAVAAMLAVESPKALQGRAAASVFRESETWKRLSGELEGGAEPFVVDTAWVRDGGGAFPVRLSASRVELHDRGGGFVFLAEDLTERHKLEGQFRQSQKLESVGRLAGGIAHDFNNRLTVIQSCAETLRDKVRDDAELTDAITSILESTSRSADLTRQLLTFSRRQVAQQRTVDLNLLLSNFQKMLRRGLAEDIAIEMELAGHACPVFVDPGQIEQVILNLASNAGDAMPNGGELRFSTRFVTLSNDDAARRIDVKSGEYVVISIRDSGCGMDEGLLANVLEPFFTTKPVGKGTGLGLSTAYWIVRQHEGHLRLSSEPGVGTTVEVWLPTADPAGLAAEHEEPAVATSGDASHRTVLVAEDDPAVLKVVRKILTGAGYDVLSASDGMEALNLACEHGGPIDALVTDWIMPEMRGPELARRLANMRPSLRVLYMSGYTDENLGADESEFLPGKFLAKPFTVQELLSGISELMQAE